MDRDAGHLYVADHRNHRIETFDLEGRWLATIGGPGVCKQPGSLAVDPITGRLFVGHGGGGRVTMFAAVRVSLAW